MFTGVIFRLIHFVQKGCSLFCVNFTVCSDAFAFRHLRCTVATIFDRLLLCAFNPSVTKFEVAQPLQGRAFQFGQKKFDSIRRSDKFAAFTLIFK